MFSMSILEAAKTSNHQINKIRDHAKRVEENYFAHLQAKASFLLEREEIDSYHRLSKRAKRNQKKADQTKSRKEDVRIAAEMNPEEEELKKGHVVPNAYKTRERENNITPSSSTESQSSSEMFVEYFVPSRKNSNNEKSAHTSPSSHQDHPSAPNTPPQHRKKGHNNHKRYE